MTDAVSGKSGSDNYDPREKGIPPAENFPKAAGLLTHEPPEERDPRRKKRVSVTLEREDSETLYLFVSAHDGYGEIICDFKLTLPEDGVKVRAAREWPVEVES